MQWAIWREELLILARLKVLRCYKPNDLAEIQAVGLHNVSDACKYPEIRSVILPENDKQSRKVTLSPSNGQV